jgi:hypothetical protein
MAMRHLVLLLASIVLAATAKAFPAPAHERPLSLPALSAAADDEGEEDGEEADGTEEAEGCEAEDSEEAEDDEAEEEPGCEEEAEEADEEAECGLESADASVAANPGSGKVRVTVRYSAFSPSSFDLDYSLRGGKGGLHLGSARARFHRSGVFHDTVTVGGRKLAKLAAVHQFVIDLHAVGTPGYCREVLTEAAPHRARRPHRAGA